MEKIRKLGRLIRAKIALGRVGVRAVNPGAEGRPPILKVRGRLEVGRNVRFRTIQLRPRLVVENGASLILGDRVFLNEGATVWATREVRIGHRVMIGNMACIYDTNAHEVRPGEGVRSGPVLIEDDVWIGRGALILPGVTIGRASTIGANAVVTKSVPPGSIVVGPAAQVVGTVQGWETYRRSA